MSKTVMVWAVCRPDGSAVAHVEWRGKAHAELLAAEFTRQDKSVKGAYFVQPRKIQQ